MKNCSTNMKTIRKLRERGFGIQDIAAIVGCEKSVVSELFKADTCERAKTLAATRRAIERVKRALAKQEQADLMELERVRLAEAERAESERTIGERAELESAKRGALKNCPVGRDPAEHRRIVEACFGTD